MSAQKTALVISAHAADFVWRCGGAIALHADKGYAVTVLCLSFGERGESAKLWKQEGMTLQRVKDERRKEAEEAARVLGVHDLVCLDLGDYPLEFSRGNKMKIVDVIRHVQPAFMLSVDLNNRQMQIRPVTAEPMQGKSYQMWIKADSLGPNPRSLGVLNDNFELERAALRDYDPELLKEATFGISVEPEGGSPTGQPTGPAIHGYLYPVADGTSDPSH